jgi:MFS family permease
MLSFLDRSNIGNANAAGMSKDLGISDPQYQWLLTIFYIAYIVFEWMVLLWKVLPPHIYATCCIFSWGLVSMLQGVAQTWHGMMALRFLLGVAEAGFGPGVPYFMSFFYLREELGKRIGTDSALLSHDFLV